MLSKRRLVVGFLAVICCVTALRATPIVGLLFANILANGNTQEEIGLHVKVPLPTGSASNVDDDTWTAKLLTSGPTTVTVQDVEYVPGGHTGWHSHPGVLVSSVTEGSIEWY